MLRFHFAVLATVRLVVVVAASLLSVSATFAQCAGGGGSNSASASSWVAGGQGGYNWQQGSWVYGFETDLSGANLKSSMSGGLTNPCPGDGANTSANIDWYGTVRGRAGWADGKVLFYGTGGLAYGRVELTSNFNSGGLSLNSQTSSVRAGWVVGGGIEYLLQPNLTLGFGYQYIDLGTANLVSSVGSPPIEQIASAHAAFSVATVALNWKFSPPATQGSALMPWEGPYVGGHAGGAWGNNTDANYSPQIFTSDIRLKRDVTLVGRLDDGLGLYRFRYLWSDTIYVGVMAQEVALIHPNAVVRDALDTYLRVDYGRLGMRLMTPPEWNTKNRGASL